MFARSNGCGNRPRTTRRIVPGGWSTRAPNSAAPRAGLEGRPQGRRLMAVSGPVPAATLDIPAARLAAVRSAMEAAARAAGRDPAAVTLVAISKTHGPEAIEPLIAAGQRVFRENRVQEAEAKWPALQAKYPLIELHLVGP